MSFLIPVLGITGLVWCLCIALRGSLLVATAGYLVLAATCGYQFLHFDLAGISLSIDRIALVVLVAVFALKTRLRLVQTIRWSVAEYLLVLFYGLLLLSIFSHDWRRAIGDQVAIVPHFIEGYLIPLMLYFVGRGSASTERELQGWYLVMGLFGCYLAWTGICEVAGIWSLVYPKYISDPSLGIHFGRARGPFLQSVRLGIMLTAGLAAVWIPLVWRRSWGKPGLLLGLVLSLVQIAGIVVTYTRSIWLGLAAGMALIVGMTFTPRWRRFCLYGLVVTGLFALPLKDQLLSMKRESGAQETLESTRMRAVFTYVSWLMFQDRPLTGFGFGHFPHEKESYLNDRATELRLESIRGYIHHNTYLSLLVELGLSGLLVYCLLLWSWGASALRLWRNRAAPEWSRGQALALLVVLATCAIQMLFHEVSYSVFEHGVLFLLAGIVSGLEARFGLPFWMRRPAGPAWGSFARRPWPAP